MKRMGRKYRWMVVLMVCSQVLLTGFVAYWLVTQYRQERTELHAKLKGIYLSTHEQLVDTLLLNHLIAPTLNDSLMLSINISDDLTSGLVNDTCEPEVIMKQVHVDSTREEEMLVRSVRLFINQTDESFRSNPTAHVFSMEIDSANLKVLFTESLGEWGEHFEVEWREEERPVEVTGKGMGLVLQNYPSLGVPEIEVKHYKGYLVRLILPQILFGLILLGLTASALIFAYRSLKKQLVLNKLRDDFMGNISHELKTPVSTVKVALEALRAFDLKKDPKRSGDYLEMASREVERLEGLVGKVLHHQVLEDPSALLQKERCDLLEMVHRVIRALEFPIRENSARVNIEGGPCPVLADPVYMEGVIVNLLDNSLKYAGKKPEIQIILTCGNGGTSLTVRDNGPGIPEEFRKQVFDKFFRVPAGNRHDVKGYGLGLNFASQVMKHHGGSITQKNLETGGCEFTLWFPEKSA